MTKQDKGETPPLDIISFKDLMKTEYATLWQPVEGMVTEGLTVFYGGAKLGKSWIAGAITLAVAKGEPFAGHITHKCPVLYLALEDSRRRLKDRNTKLLHEMADISGLSYSVKCHTMDDGLQDQLDAWLTEQGQRALVVIDVLQLVRGMTRGKENEYQADYRCLSALKAIADKHGAALLVLHHTNKRGEMSGSTGIAGVADTLIQLKRERGELSASLDISGRDVEGETVKLTSTDGIHWERQAEYKKTDDRRARYDNSQIAQAIKTLAANNPDGGKISYKELREMCEYYPYLSTKSLAADFSKWIIEDLSVYDHISVTCGVQVYDSSGRHEKGIEYHTINKAC
jgi:hypothetical protein